MKIGDTLVVKSSGQIVTAKSVTQPGFVLVFWPEMDGDGKVIEGRCAYRYEDLRMANTEERLRPVEPIPCRSRIPAPDLFPNPTEPAPREPQTVTAAEVGAVPASIANEPEKAAEAEHAAPEPHKRKR